MTDDEGSSPNAATNEHPAPNPGGRGIPRGRYFCGICGVEGANARTCPGDGAPHIPTWEYRERCGQGPTPRPAAPSDEDIPIMENTLRNFTEAATLRQDYEAAQDEAEQAQARADHEAEFGSLVWDGVGRAPEEPQEGLQVSSVTIRLATTYPALSAARLEAFISDELDECLWLSTDIREMR